MNTSINQLEQGESSILLEKPILPLTAFQLVNLFTLYIKFSVSVLMWEGRRRNDPSLTVFVAM